MWRNHFRGGFGSHYVEESFWKRLWTCRQTDYWIINNKCTSPFVPWEIKCPPIASQQFAVKVVGHYAVLSGLLKLSPFTSSFDILLIVLRRSLNLNGTGRVDPDIVSGVCS